MTPQQLKAIKLALKALEAYGKRHRATHLLGGAWDEEITLGDKAITALEEALAEHAMREVQRIGQEIEQEPKCGAIIEVFGKDWRLEFMSLPVGKHKLYTQQYIYITPPQRTWVWLTDDEIKALASWWPSYDQMPALMVLAKDIQNSLKEKNT